MSFKKSLSISIPTSLTLGNLFLGAVGITLAFKGNLLEAAYCVLFSNILDFFDGFAARLLKVESDLGKELDSLADVVSFGMLPSVLIFKILEQQGFALPYFAYFLLLCAAYRLAVFNIDTQQTTSFLGLPTPASALFWAGFTHLIALPATPNYLSEPYLIVMLTFLMGFLSVSRLPFFALKKWGTFKTNFIEYLLLALALVSLIFLGYAGLSVAIVLYIFLSFLKSSLTKAG